MEWVKGQFSVSTDKERLDRLAVHSILESTYWNRGISKERAARAMDHSICFGIYEGQKLVGFSRVLTDYTNVAHLMDVFVLESHRGKGLATWMLQCALSHPELQGLRRWSLATKDAHDLYRKLGFVGVDNVERLMMKIPEDSWFTDRV